ncbi:MAG: hypothetical protein U1F43_34730 [Myxococcota bacterium]
MPATPEPQLASQPDGSAFLRVLRGDERDSHMETLDGYSIVRAADGTWVFAELDAHGELAPTDLVVGAVDPGLTGLVPHLQRLARAPEPPRPPAPLSSPPTSPQPACARRASAPRGTWSSWPPSPTSGTTRSRPSTRATASPPIATPRS